MITSSQSTRADEFVKESRAYYCLECGKCTARCPIARADKSFSPILNIVRFVRGYDQEIRRDGAIWACMICEACSTACPSDVDYPRLVLGMRAEAVKSGDARTHRRKLEEIFLGDGQDEGFGIFHEVSAVQKASGGDDRGVVTSLLLEGMRSGLFDSAVVVRRGTCQRAEAFIAENPEEIISAQGSKYELVPVPEKFIEAVVERGKKKIAIVGLPCQVVGIREIQKTMPDIDLTVIGLFCMENFRYQILKQSITDILHIDLDTAESVFISQGEFIVSVNGKRMSCRVKDLIAAVRAGCLFCTDFTSELADISVGMVGSPDGYSSVIVRSEKGAELFHLIKERNRTSADLGEIAGMASRKEKRGFNRFIKDFPQIWDADER